MKPFLLAIFVLVPLFLSAQNTDITLQQGMVIRQSSTVKTSIYPLESGVATFTSAVDLAAIEGVITIEGENITVDFQGAELRSTADVKRPDLFAGLAIRIKGNNITLKNAIVRGFKVALLASDATNLRLENCDFSYNYRPRLRSIREREDFSDWLSYHHNEQDEWLRYGAGIYLKNCTAAMVKGCRITGVQNALLMTGCNDATVYNNYFHFNSGLGIGLYRSSRNKLMHNMLDWNVRGYSHGIYARGQDSAAILVYEQSNENLIAFNSATHSGDGLFLWAGQSTMDSGKGGCNDNFIYGNDFSRAPTNGVEVTFSRNKIQGNLIRECTHGIWGGYSYESVIMGNLIAECKTGIAIEHGQQNTLSRNLFMGDSTGINLWARESQPADWSYAKTRDVRNRDAVIDRNVFLTVPTPLKISNSQNISVNGENLFFDFNNVLETPKPNEGLKFLRNDLYGDEKLLAQNWKNPVLAASKNLNFSHNGEPENPYAPLDIPLSELKEPDSLPDGMIAVLPDAFPQGRQFIMVDEWGPFDFRRPMAVLDTLAGNMYSLVLIGPSGDWRVNSMKGIKTISAKKGVVPATITVERDPAASALELVFEYISPQAITTVFGEKIAAGRPYQFDFKRFEKKLSWKVRYFHYTGDAPSEGFAKEKAVLEKTVPELYFAWWGKPEAGLQEDKFATESTSTFDMAPGEYVFELTSDDGVRLFLDDKLLIDRWNIHEPVTDEVTVTLGGRHTIRVEHFEATGFATLGFRVQVR
jgi:parallel beta-helix repeat protein